MAATITTQSGMLPTSGDALTRYRAEERRRGVNLGFGPVPAGQLWERVAETPSNAPAPLTARQDEGIVRAYEWAHLRSRLLHSGGRGPTVRFALTFGAPRMVQGIIRAGVRVK